MRAACLEAFLVELTQGVRDRSLHRELILSIALVSGVSYHFLEKDKTLVGPLQSSLLHGSESLT